MLYQPVQAGILFPIHAMHTCKQQSHDPRTLVYTTLTIMLISVYFRLLVIEKIHPSVFILAYLHDKQLVVVGENISFCWESQ